MDIRIFVLSCFLIVVGTLVGTPASCQETSTSLPQCIQNKYEQPCHSSCDLTYENSTCCDISRCQFCWDSQGSGLCGENGKTQFEEALKNLRDKQFELRNCTEDQRHPSKECKKFFEETDEDQNAGSNESHKWMIIWIVVTSIGIILWIILIVVCLSMRKKSKTILRSESFQ